MEAVAVRPRERERKKERRRERAEAAEVGGAEAGREERGQVAVEEPPAATDVGDGRDVSAQLSAPRPLLLSESADGGAASAAASRLYPADPAFSFGDMNGTLNGDSVRSFADRADFPPLPYAFSAYPAVPSVPSVAAAPQVVPREPPPRVDTAPSAPEMDWDDFYDVAKHYEEYYGMANSVHRWPDAWAEHEARQAVQDPPTALAQLSTLASAAAAAASRLPPLAADLARSVWQAVRGFREEEWSDDVRARVDAVRGAVEGLVREAYPQLRNATAISISALASLAAGPTPSTSQTPLSASDGTTYPPIAAEPRDSLAHTAAHAAADAALGAGRLAGRAAVAFASLAAAHGPPLARKLVRLLATSDLPPGLVAGIYNLPGTLASVLAYLAASSAVYTRRIADRRYRQDGGRGAVVMDDGREDKEEGGWLVVGETEDSGGFMEPGGI